jgi:site-specific DNA-methyltransferase (adenine-specific)
MKKTSQIDKLRAPRNRTLVLDGRDIEQHRPKLAGHGETSFRDRVVNADAFDALAQLPHRSYDLLFADPPYNLTKKFGKEKFVETSSNEYESWLDSWLKLCAPLLAPTASVYICGDWRSGSAIQRVGEKYFKLRNRITWEREKGRGAKANWKNASEDIWFFTVSDHYTFNIDYVKLKRKVVAPYTSNGKPKDWDKEADGNFRTTHPSNLWTDISVPFWSMPENTDHPTQKPEKLLAKIILASTDKGDSILDPFAGSGTTAVAAKKLGRHFTAIESDEKYCLLALKRLELAESNNTIQGYTDGIFWERNALMARNPSAEAPT